MKKELIINKSKAVIVILAGGQSRRFGGGYKTLYKLNNISILDRILQNFKKLKINPSNIIEDTKSKIGNYYINLKQEREKEKKLLEKKRKLDEKKELQKQKRQAQRERLEKIKDEKRQILAQQKLIIDR